MRRFASYRGLVVSVALILMIAYVGLVALRVLYPVAYTKQILSLANEYEIDPELVAAVIRCESRFRADAVSPRGAIGLMQIMPETGAWIAQQLTIPRFEIDQLLEPDLNLRLGMWYLRSLLDRFGTHHDALTAYNAGPSNAERWLNGVETVFPETSVYVKRVARSVPVYRFYFHTPWLLRITPSLLL